MKSCPKCAKKYDDSWKVCFDCRVQLVDVNIRLVQLEAKANKILQEIKEIKNGAVQKNTEAKPNPSQELVLNTQQTKPKMTEDTEIQIGKYWLNKIGIVTLVSGIAFFIAYAFRYLAPVYKIAISYIMSIGLLLWGIKLEANTKFNKYGASLIAGGWALIYFVTFAMYHIEAVRIIQNQITDLLLLVVLIGIMIAHLLKYKSQSIVALVLFLGYFTAGISQISSFTLIYIALLTVIAGILSYKMQWHKLPVFSMIATYCTHSFWTHLRFIESESVIVSQQFWLTFGFSILYWITYTVVSFSIKADNEKHENTISNSVFLNAFLFGLQGGLAFHVFNPELKFNFFFIVAGCIAAVSVIPKIITAKKFLFHPYLMAAILFLTASLPFKLDKEWVNVFWFAELPIFVYLGLNWKTVLYRISAGVLAVIVFFNTLWLLTIKETTMMVLGQEIPTLMLTLSTGMICLYLSKLLYKKHEIILDNKEESYVSNVYVFAGTIILGLLIFKEMPKQFISLSWGVSALALFAVGFFIKDKYFRYAALYMVAVIMCRIIFVDLATLDIIYRIVAFVGLGAIFLAVSYFYNRGNVESKQGKI